MSGIELCIELRLTSFNMLFERNLTMIRYSSIVFALSLLMATWSAHAQTHQMNPSDLEVPIADVKVVAQGGELFSEKCSACHGGRGVGTGRAPCVSCGKFMFRGNTNSEIYETIHSGTPRTGSRGGKMGAFSSVLNNDQIIAVVTYLRATEQARIASSEIKDPYAENQDAMVFPE